MPYFLISVGLRGCYIDDSYYIVRAKTRRELKSIISDECDSSREAYGHGGSQKEIAWTCARIWQRAKEKKSSLYPYAIGFGRSRSTKDRPFGVFVNTATRREYLDYLKNNE